MSTNEKTLQELVKELTGRGLLGGATSQASLTSEADSTLPREIAAMLRSRRESYLRTHAFKPGDLVQWKAGLKNKNSPAYGTPAIVMEVFAAPRIDPNTDGGSAYFNEPLDIVAGVIVKGVLTLYHFDSKRFEPFDEANAEAGK